MIYQRGLSLVALEGLEVDQSLTQPAVLNLRLPARKSRLVDLVARIST